MDSVSLSQIALWTDAHLLSGDVHIKVTGISHNTRELKPGDLYIALEGERFDGHEFIQEAVKRGAVGVLCKKNISSALPSSFGVLQVKDTFQALRMLALAWRDQILLRSVVLTGSSGKTTTKDFIASILRSSFEVTATSGNFNNHIGLPLSILNASRSDQIAVWEIGMNHRGEIAPLAALAKPDIAVITNIGTAHIGFLGSRAAIAEEKGDLLAALSKEGVAILPAGDDFCEVLSKRTEARIVRVGLDQGDLQASNLKVFSEGIAFQVFYQGKTFDAFLPVIGAHMVVNALLALAVAIECGIPLEKGVKLLKDIQPSKSRLAIKKINGVTFIDDAYNANPDSMEAALEAVKNLNCSGRRIALLGRMGELGEYECEGYQRVGKKSASSTDVLITVGKETAFLAEAANQAGLKEIYQLKNNEEAISFLSSYLQPEDIVLIKGSLSAGLQEVVHHFITD